MDTCNGYYRERNIESDDTSKDIPNINIDIQIIIYT